MNRRELIKTIACSGASLGLLNFGLSSRAHAVVSDHHWVFITANGGWDVTSQWDAKGREIEGPKGEINRYSRSEIRTAGNLRYAPVPEGVSSSDQLHLFTQKHFNTMTVIHGIDQGTNSHSVGRRVAMVGSDAKGLPALGAFFAAPYEANQSMPFIVAGGYSDTAGLLPESKLLSRNGYAQILTPDKHLGTDAAFEVLNRKKSEQIDALLAQAKTQADINALNKLATARNGAGGVAELLERIPGELSRDAKYAAVEMAAAGFASGAATSLSINSGGFDTHSDNDQNQWEATDELLLLVEHLIHHLTLQGVLQKTTIVINSDFGRRPFYNDRNGKDHWPITSMVLMGAGIEGNRVLGGTDDGLNAKLYHPQSLEEDENGIAFNPRSIYASLRRLAGIEGGALDQRYPLNAQYMAVFDPA